MKTKLQISFLLLTLFDFSSFGQKDIIQSDKLKKLWEVNGLNVPESVLPVPTDNKIFVSNIANPSPVEKDSSGYISIIDLNGKIIELKWASGLNAPKGMGIFDLSLYVTDIDRIAEIDIKTGLIKKFYPVKGSKFLNDIAVSPDGILYISDSQSKKVYKFDQGKITELIHVEEYAFPNGIIWAENKLLLGTGDKIVAIDPISGVISNYSEYTGGIDGLALLSSGKLLFSDWSGKVSILEKGKEIELLLDTSKIEKSQSADFGYYPEKNLIYVPTFYGNSLVCYELTDK